MPHLIKSLLGKIPYLGECSWDSRRQDRAGPGSSRPRTGRRAGPPVSPPGTWDTEHRDGRRRGQGEGPEGPEVKEEGGEERDREREEKLVNFVRK